MKIDPIAQAVQMLGPDLSEHGGGDKWMGGVRGPDGCVYGIPREANRVLKVDPETQAVPKGPRPGSGDLDLGDPGFPPRDPSPRTSRGKKISGDSCAARFPSLD